MARTIWKLQLIEKGKERRSEGGKNRRGFATK